MKNMNRSCRGTKIRIVAVVEYRRESRPKYRRPPARLGGISGRHTARGGEKNNWMIITCIVTNPTCRNKHWSLRVRGWGDWFDKVRLKYGISKPVTSYFNQIIKMSNRPKA